MTDFDWTKDDDVLSSIGAQLTVGIALLVNEGRYTETDLANGYLTGRYMFQVHKDGVVLLEAAPQPKGKQ